MEPLPLRAHNVDKFDQQIIEALRENARQSVMAIAERVNLSRSAVSDRIKKMEQSGTIRGYQVLLSESQKEGVAAYFEIHHQCNRCREIASLFRKIPEVQICSGVTGEMDLLVYVKAESMQRLHEIREYLEGVNDITKIRTHVVMSEWINNTGVAV